MLYINVPWGNSVYAVRGNSSRCSHRHYAGNDGGFYDKPNRTDSRDNDMQLNYELSPSGMKRWTLIRHIGIPLHAGGRLITPYRIVWWWPINWFHVVVSIPEFLCLMVRAWL